MNRNEVQYINLSNQTQNDRNNIPVRDAKRDEYHKTCRVWSIPHTCFDRGVPHVSSSSILEGLLLD